MLCDKDNKKNILIPLIKNLIKYQVNLIKLIFDNLENIIIEEYFQKYRVEIWYCFIHDQGFLIEILKDDDKIEDIYTKTCGHYCHIEFIDNFNENFIKNYSVNNRDLDYKLLWFLNCFYDYKKDEFIGETPFPIRLFYEKVKSRIF